MNLKYFLPKIQIEESKIESMLISKVLDLVKLADLSKATADWNAIYNSVNRFYSKGKFSKKKIRDNLSENPNICLIFAFGISYHDAS